MKSAKEIWRIWLDQKRSPFVNMAIDELLLVNSSEDKGPIVRIYGWDRPAVSIGYIQEFSAAPDTGYTVVRRLTGGGVVFHDYDLTYTVVIPAHHRFNKLDRLESYHVFHRAVLTALAEFGLQGTLAVSESGPVDRATMQCFTTPTRYDVICGNRKCAGAAQRRNKSGILHQGSIVLDVAEGDRGKLREALLNAFKTEFEIEFREFVPGARFLADAEDLARSKYSSPDWNINKHRKSG